MEEDKVIDEDGVLILFKNASDEDIKLMIDLLSDEYSVYLRVLYNIIDDRNKFLMVLDVLSEQRFYFPERRKVYKTLEKVMIYNYVRDRGFDQGAISDVAKQYSKRTEQVRKIIKKINEKKNGQLIGEGKDDED